MALPLVSSDELLAALARAGFTVDRSRGSHATLKKAKPEGGHLVVVVVLGKKEIPRGTLKRILTQANLSEAHFRALL